MWLRTRAGRILSAPYTQEVNDIPAIVVRKDGAEAFATMIVDAFDEMLEESRAQLLLFAVALHPYIMGQPHRLRRLRGALAHIAAARDRVWITRASAISAFCHGLPEGVIA